MGIKNTIRERLADLWVHLSEEFDLSGSKVRPGVKGGRSRPGATVDQYISFKNVAGRNLALVVFQMGSTRPLECEVLLRDTARGSVELAKSNYPYGSFHIAVDELRTKLGELAPDGRAR